VTAFAEIGVTTNFSFLRGASHPKEFVAQAAMYGYAAIGIASATSATYRQASPACSPQPRSPSLRNSSSVRMIASTF